MDAAATLPGQHKAAKRALCAKRNPEGCAVVNNGSGCGEVNHSIPVGRHAVVAEDTRRCGVPAARQRNRDVVGVRAPSAQRVVIRIACVLLIGNVVGDHLVGREVVALFPAVCKNCILDVLKPAGAAHLVNAENQALNPLRINAVEVDRHAGCLVGVHVVVVERANVQRQRCGSVELHLDAAIGTYLHNRSGAGRRKRGALQNVALRKSKIEDRAFVGEAVVVDAVGGCRRGVFKLKGSANLRAANALRDTLKRYARRQVERNLACFG